MDRHAVVLECGGLDDLLHHLGGDVGAAASVSIQAGLRAPGLLGGVRDEAGGQTVNLTV